MQVKPYSKTSFGERPEQVNVTVMPDPRKKTPTGNLYIVFRLSYAYKTNYIRLENTTVTESQWTAIVAGKNDDRSKDIRRRIKVKELSLAERINEILSAGSFSFDLLKSKTIKETVTTTDFLAYWTDFISSKRAGTAASYRNVLNSFRQFFAREYGKGREVCEIPFGMVTPEVITAYATYLEDTVSIATTGIYLRSLRAVINAAIKAGKLNACAACFGKEKAIQIKRGKRRREDYLPVADILKLWEYKSANPATERGVKLWLALYCSCGANLIDLAQMTYNDSYFADGELSFVRTKTAHSAQGGEGVTVYVPITDQLKQLLHYFGSIPERGKRVFPFILGDTERNDEQLRSRIHDVNRATRKAIQTACKELGIEREVSPHFARNSFQTNLKRHYVPFSYLKEAAGHSDGGDVTEGYQASFTPKQRLKFNNKLFVLPPEETEDDE